MSHGSGGVPPSPSTQRATRKPLINDGVSVEENSVAVLFAIIVVAAGTTWFVTRTSPYPFNTVAEKTTPSDALIERGEYVARLGDCVACHSTPDSNRLPAGWK